MMYIYPMHSFPHKIQTQLCDQVSEMGPGDAAKRSHRKFQTESPTTADHYYHQNRLGNTTFEGVPSKIESGRLKIGCQINPQSCPPLGFRVQSAQIIMFFLLILKNFYLRSILNRPNLQVVLHLRHRGINCTSLWFQRSKVRIKHYRCQALLFIIYYRG